MNIFSSFELALIHTAATEYEERAYFQAQKTNDASYRKSLCEVEKKYRLIAKKALVAQWPENHSEVN